MSAVQVRWKSVSHLSALLAASAWESEHKGAVGGAYRDITRLAGQAMTSAIELNSSMPFPALIHARNYGIYFQIFKAVYQVVQMLGCVAAFCLSAHSVKGHKRAGHWAEGTITWLAGHRIGRPREALYNPPASGSRPGPLVPGPRKHPGLLLPQSPVIHFSNQETACSQ